MNTVEQNENPSSQATQSRMVKVRHNAHTTFNVSASLFQCVKDFDSQNREAVPQGGLLGQLCDAACAAKDEIQEGYAIDGLDTEMGFEGPFTVKHDSHPRMELWLAWSVFDGVTISYPSAAAKP